MKINSITALIYPYDRSHDRYQEYYGKALEAYCASAGIAFARKSTALSDGLLRRMQTVRNSYKLRNVFKVPLAAGVVDAAARVVSRGKVRPVEPAGVYEIEGQGGERFDIAIDPSDPGAITPELAARVKVYFKSNYWPAREYPANVIPLPNMNPLVGREMDYFRGLRATPKTTDLFAFFRVWGGSDEVEGVEHNLALIEALAKVQCRKFLKAYLVAGDIATIGKRLTSQGIEWTTQPMAQKELWARAAAARMNLVRLGMNECSPWRMIDILAMGGCPVIDYGPQTRWPEPLVEGKHFLTLKAAPGGDGMKDVPARMQGWLDQDGLLEAIGRNTADYFDRMLDFEPLGESIVRGIEEAMSR